MTLRRPISIDARLISTGDIKAPNGYPVMNGVVRIDLANDRTRGLLRTHLSKAIFNGRSGHARVGIDSKLIEPQSAEISSHHADFHIQLASLRGAENDRLLTVIKELAASAKGSRFDIGRVLLMDREQAFSRAQVEAAMGDKIICLSSEATILDDGSVEVPLLPDYHLDISERLLSIEDVCADVLHNGKHALTGVQGPSLEPMPEFIEPGEFLVPGMKLATAHTAVLDRQTNAEGVFQLSAMYLDENRTSGAATPRELELYNDSDRIVKLEEFRARLRFFTAKDERKVRVFGRIIERGIEFRDAIDIHSQEKEVLEIMNGISGNNRDQNSIYARIIGPGRSADIDWEKRPKAQDRLTKELTSKMISKRPGYFEAGDKIPKNVRFIAEGVRDVGGDQRNSKVFISYGFPAPETMNYLIDQGMGVFFAHDLRQTADAYQPELSANDKKYNKGTTQANLTNHSNKKKVSKPKSKSLLEDLVDTATSKAKQGLRNLTQRALKSTGLSLLTSNDHTKENKVKPTQVEQGETNIERDFNDLNFTGDLYEAFLRMEKRGAKFFMLMKELMDDSGEETKTIDAHVREFYKGFWVRPEERERFDKVNTVIAMYGSHVNGMDPVLRPGLESFLERMKKRFGDHLGITHGKGPGVMQTADDIAAEKGIFRMGVGINLEQKDRQKPNYAPEAMVDFLDTDRLPRQRIMDDISTFKIFNVGGAGTLEEAAISLCSQKLGKNIITPIIFVDPVGFGKDRSHLFDNLRKQIDLLAKSHTIKDKDKKIALENIQLLRSHAAKFCHFVDSYDKAADIIEKFADNPEQYYNDIGLKQAQLDVSIENAKATRERTGMSMPYQWFPEKIQLAA